MLNAAEPRSNARAADRRGVDQLGEHLGQLARRPAAEAVGPEHPVDPLVRRQQHGRDSTGLAALGRKTVPDLISTTQPSVTSPIVTAPRRSGAAAIETQHDSSPASAGRVPSIGSTTSTLARAVGRRRARGPRSRRRRPGARSARNRSSSSSASASIANVTSPPVAERAGVRALRRARRAAAARARAARARARARARASAGSSGGRGRSPSSTSTVRRLAVRARPRASPSRPGSSRLISVRAGRSVCVSFLAVHRDDHVAVRRDVASGPGTRSCAVARRQARVVGRAVVHDLGDERARRRRRARAGSASCG